MMGLMADFRLCDQDEDDAGDSDRVIGVIMSRPNEGLQTGDRGSGAQGLSESGNYQG